MAAIRRAAGGRLNSLLSPIHHTLRAVGQTTTRPILIPNRWYSNNNVNDNDDETPWYIRDPDSVQAQLSVQKAVIPDLPENPPHSLEPIASEMVKDLGLEDLTILDLREVVPPSSFGPDALMIIASGKSEKHLVRAATELSKWVKNRYNVLVDQEGLLTSNFSKVHQRRMRKKAARQSSFYVKQNDETAMKTANSWVALDTKVDGIYVHLFTPERRKIVNIEELWKDAIESQQHQSDATTTNTNMTMNKFSQQYATPGLKRSYHTGTTPKSQELSLKEYCDAGDYKSCISAVQLHHAVDNENLVLKSHINHVHDISNHKTERAPLKKNSPVVVSFMNSLPPVLESHHWRLRLIFLQNAHLANPSDFPLQMLIDQLMFQQASGVAVSDWDAETVVTAICYSHQVMEYTGHLEMKASEIWSKQCDQKFALILQLMDLVYRPSGKAMSASNTLLSLMYRLCIQPNHRYITYDSALKDPTPTSPKLRGKLDSRAHSIAHLFKNFHIASEENKTLMALVLLSLANEQEWRKFWDTWQKVALSGNIDISMLLFMTSIVTKASDERAIGHLLDTVLPTVILGKGTSLMSPELATTINQAMNFVDPKQAAYTNLRTYIKQYEEKEAAKVSSSKRQPGDVLESDEDTQKGGGIPSMAV